MQIGVEKGRRRAPDLKIGICGEHGGDPDTRQVLPQDRAELRELQPVPRADRATGGRAGGAGEIKAVTRGEWCVAGENWSPSCIWLTATRSTRSGARTSRMANL